MSARASKRWSIEGMADTLSLDRRTIAKIIRDNNIEPTGTQAGNPVYDLGEVVRAKEGAPQREPSIPDEDDLTPNQRLIIFKAKNEELTYDLRCKELIEIKVFRSRIASLCKTMSSFLDILPETLERKCGLEPTHVTVMQEEIDQLRNQLVDDIDGIQ